MNGWRMAREEDDGGRREMVKDEDDVESDVRLDLMSATRRSR